jgi:DNA polymerase-3 subunit delta
VIVVLFGANELAMRRRLQELKDEADGGSGMLVTNLVTVDGRDARPGDVLAPCMAPPFLAPKRLVIVEHLLERFESRGGPRGPRNLGPWEQLVGELEAGIPETTTLVFFGQPFLVEGRQRAVTRTNPLVAALAKLKGVSIEEHPELQKDDLLRYINEEAALRGIKFRRGGVFESHEERPPETDPAQLLANLLQGDTLSIANELDKLALYARDNGGEVDVAVVNRVSHGDRETKAWDLTDAVVNCQLGAALGALKSLAENGENLQGLLGLITSKYRALAPVADLVAAGMALEAIAAELGRPNNFPMRKDVEAAKRLGPAGVKRAYEYIVEADRTNKMGEVDEDVSIELLLIKLCSLAGPVPPRGYRQAPGR